MKVCILGNSLTSLTLAKSLVNQGICVDMIPDTKTIRPDKMRTIGISKSNLNFFNKNILDIENLTWKIKRIKIFSDHFQDKEILNFQEDNNLFSIVQNSKLYKILILSLKKNVLFKLKKNNSYQNLSNNYDLVFNCNSNHLITKKFFYKKIDKNYKSNAFVSIIEHKKIEKNNTAIQFFTKKGPLAFLPVSKTKTSIVYSVKGKDKIDFKSQIKKYGSKFHITKIYDPKNFELKSSILRVYFKENFLAFGDLLHKIHPLAGQGFNMTLRDIIVLLSIIKLKKDNGLPLDNSVCREFEKKVKHKNYLFSNGIDFIYEFFNFESKLKNNILSKSIQLLGEKEIVNKFFTKLADKGV